MTDPDMTDAGDRPGRARAHGYPPMVVPPGREPHAVRLDSIDPAQENPMPPTQRGPEVDHRGDQLRSIANRIQPAFPEAADELRAIANDPPPPGLVDRMRQVLETATTRLVYGNAEQLEEAAGDMARIDELVGQHSAGLRRAIGPALLNAEAYGTGWIRIDATTAGADGETGPKYDWRISAPKPGTITVHNQPRSN